MKSTVKLEDGRLSVSVYALLDELTPEEQAEVVESLSCQDAIIKHVADQILDGFTENGSWGYEGTGISTISSPTPLEAARRRVAEMAGDVARRELKRMSGICERSHEQEKRYSDWAWELFHAWPEHSTGIRPEWPR